MEQLLITIISVLFTGMLAAIGYFLKRIFEKTDNIGIDISEIKPKVDILWRDKYAPALSPRQLNEKGQSILNQSGIKEIIEENREKLFAEVKALNPTNAYDAEQTILDVVNEIPKHYPELIPRLKDGAFRVGQSVDALLLVGGIHLRNMIFGDLGFSMVDLDKTKTV